MSAKTIKFKVTLSIAYNPNGDALNAIKDQLENAMSLLDAEGLLSGDLAAEVESFKFGIETEAQKNRHHDAAL